MKKMNSDSAITYVIKPFSLGYLLLAQSEIGVCAIALGDDKNILESDICRQFTDEVLREDNTNKNTLVDTLIGFVDEKSILPEINLDIRGTEFEKKVWSLLCQIPSGTTVTYSELAKSLGAPKAFRAVASACAANNIAIIIPCHRVVRSNGQLANYRWGIKRKKELLKREEQLRNRE